MDIINTAHSIRTYFSSLPEVKKCTVYGSLAGISYDEYSDIDIELDVSGEDNSLYALKIPELLGRLYPVIFFDYAPGLMPDSYIVSCAISYENPFLMVDVKCVAAPHCSTLSKSDFPFDRVDHTLKVFVANLKHMIRGADCAEDIGRMYARVCGSSHDLAPEDRMERVFHWLESNAEDRHQNYLDSLRRFL